MTDTPSLEDRLVAWLAYLGSEKAETTPIASVVCPTGESLADDLRAALATLQPDGIEPDHSDRTADVTWGELHAFILKHSDEWEDEGVAARAILDAFTVGRRL